MPRPKATSYRLGDETLSLIDSLSQHLSQRNGFPVSASDVVRGAITALAEREGLLTPPKKSRIKSKSSIANGDTKA